MRLSDAIMLGSTLLKPGPFRWVHGPDYGYGCALDMAVVAVNSCGFWQDAKLIWPELYYHNEFNQSLQTCIIHKFEKVTDGTLTMDAFVDWVRSVEPSEVSAETVSQSEKETVECLT